MANSRAIVLSTLNDHIIYVCRRPRETTLQELVEDFPDAILDMIMDVDVEDELILMDGYHRYLDSLWVKAAKKGKNKSAPMADLSVVFNSAYCKKFFKKISGDDFKATLQEQKKSFIADRKWIRHIGREVGLFEDGVMSKTAIERYKAWLNGEDVKDADDWNEVICRNIARFFCEFYDSRWYEIQYIAKEGGATKQPESFKTWYTKVTKRFRKAERERLTQRDALWEAEDAAHTDQQKTEFKSNMNKWKAVAIKAIGKFRENSTSVAKYADTADLIEYIKDNVVTYPLLTDWKETLGYKNSSTSLEDIISRARSLKKLFAPDKFRQNDTTGELFAEWAGSCWDTIARHMEVAKQTIPRLVRQHQIIDLDQSDEIIDVSG